MNPFLWGLGSAVTWGSADFVARVSGRAIGPVSSVFGMFFSGAILLTLWILLSDHALVWGWTGVVWVVLSGLATAGGTWLLYASLSRGPVSVASPLVASFPVFIVIGGLILGIVPKTEEWIGMIVVMAGIWVVARTGHGDIDQTVAGRGGIGLTVIYGLGASLVMASALLFGREASIYYGEIQTTWLIRLCAFVAFGLYILVLRIRLSLPLRWWPAVGSQGALDTIGWITFLVGGVGAGAPLAAVGAAPLTVVTVMLARFVLKEAIPLAQWAGILLVVIGGGILAYFG